MKPHPTYSSRSLIRSADQVRLPGRTTLAASLVALAGLIAVSNHTAQAGTIAYQSPAPLAGNQAFGGPLGMDFDVSCGAIAITQLGAFDADQDGIKRTIRIYIYDRDTQTAVVGPVSFAPGDDGTLIGGSRFKPLPEPVVLPGGFHGSIVAENYGAEEMLRGQAAPPLSILHSGGGLIAFVGSGRYGLTQGAYPDSPDSGPVNRYHAGTFEFVPGPGPDIVVPPQSQTVAEGLDASFFVTASGVEPLTFQWQFNGVNLDFETNPDLSLFNVSTANAGDYRVIVTDGDGNAKCVGAHLIVAPAAPALAFDPSTITSATAQGYAPGVANYFDVTPGCSIVITELGTVLFQESLTNTVTVQLFRVADASVLATVTFDEADSSTPVASTPALNLYLKALPSPLALGPDSYAVAILGSGPGAQYARNPLTPSLHPSGAIRNISSRWASDPGGPGSLPGNVDGPGFFYVAGTFTMSVSGAPVITEQPQGGIFSPGSDVTLSVTAGGSEPLTYQWRKDGSDLPGATAATLPLTALTTDQSGVYDVVISNSLGTATSGQATITVADPPTVDINLHAGIVITGVVGLHYRVEYRASLDPAADWQVLVDIPALPSSPYVVYDPTPANEPERIYQVLLLP